MKSFRKMQKLRDQGLIRTLGVSNFTAEHVDQLADECGELQAWSPLGRGTGLLEDPRMVQIAEGHGVCAGQVGLRWLWQKGVLSAVKASSSEHRRQNLDIFGFELTEDEVAVLDAFERHSIGADPRTHEEF